MAGEPLKCSSTELRCVKYIPVKDLIHRLKWEECLGKQAKIFTRISVNQKNIQ